MPKDTISVSPFTVFANETRMRSSGQLYCWADPSLKGACCV